MNCFLFLFIYMGVYFFNHTQTTYMLSCLSGQGMGRLPYMVHHMFISTLIIYFQGKYVKKIDERTMVRHL